MLNKNIQPSIEEIEAYIKAEGYERLLKIDHFLNESYDLSRELRFPFGNNYGWGFKYSHKSKHLCYVFIEQGAFTLTLQIGDKEAPALEKKLPYLLPKTREYWLNRYPCGEHGGWIHYRVLADEELPDIYELIRLKKKPSKA